jgi:hypothetical protein
MRWLRNITVAAALLTAIGLAVADEGQGPVKSDNVRIDDLRLGEYWYGAPLSQSDLIGKVVLVEIWGS